MRQPANRVALARPRRVLDQVELAGALLPGVGHQPAHGVELVVAGEQQRPLAGLPALVVLLLDHLDEVLDQVQHAVPAPRLLPQVRRGEPLPRRRVAGPAVAPQVEGQEAGLRAFQGGGEVHEVGVHGEVGQTAPEGEERLPRITVVTVLADGVLDVLALERVLQFGGEDRQAVEEEDDIEAVVVRLAVLQLPDDAELVGLVEPLGRLVQAGGGPEEGKLELAPGVLDPLAENVEGAPLADLGGEPLEETGLHVGAVLLLELLPLLGLGGVEEVQHHVGVQAERAVVVVGLAFAVASRHSPAFFPFLGTAGGRRSSPARWPSRSSSRSCRWA